jgi:N-acetylglucosaminyldiphosphoundecaprenol N-acetyl-beta-D-mannosaminyltransferase
LESVFAREVHCLLGLPFDAVDMAGAVRSVREAAEGGRPCFLSTPNLNFVVGCRADRAFRDSVLESDLSVVDGMPLVWIARLLGVPIRERVAGADLFARLKAEGARPLKVYFFGGGEGVAEAAARNVNVDARCCGVRCVGWESPGTGSVEALSRRESLERINASGADCLIVALGAKKGQAWIQRNRPALAVPVVSHLGAVINFEAGTVRRAPAWMQRGGLEWAWRIREELGLWRRYLVDGVAFARLFAFRVLPLAWQLRRKPGAQALAAARADIFEGSDETVLRLRGAWCRENLAPLRALVASAAARSKNVRLNLAAVTHIDTAFVGLASIAYGALSRKGRRVTCWPLSKPALRALRYACAEFLVPPQAARGTAAEDGVLEEEQTANR